MGMANTEAPAPTGTTDALRFVFDPKASTWAIFCDSDYCEGRELEEGFHLLADAVEETKSHHCENEAEAAYDRRYDMSWSRPA